MAEAASNGDDSNAVCAKDASALEQVPPEGVVYVVASLRGYSQHLQSYYTAATEGRLSEVVPVSLNHQMMANF